MIYHHSTSHSKYDAATKLGSRVRFHCFRHVIYRKVSQLTFTFVISFLTIGTIYNLLISLIIKKHIFYYIIQGRIMNMIPSPSHPMSTLRATATSKHLNNSLLTLTSRLIYVLNLLF